MTQLSPKPGSSNSQNGHIAYSGNAPVDGRIPANSYSPSPPHQIQSYQGQKLTQWSQSNEMEHIPLPQGYRRQRKFGVKWLTASLRAKTLVAAIAIGTIPVLGIGTFAYFSTAQGIEKQNFSYLKTSNQDLLDKLVLFMDERYRDIQIYSSLAILTDAKVSKATSTARKNELLNSYVKSSGIYDSIAVTDLKGEYVYKSDAETLDNATGLDWFEGALKTDRPFISEPRASKSTGIFSIFVSAPIKEENTGKTIAIIRARLPVAALQQVFQVTGERKQDFFAFDSSNKIFSTTAEKAAGQSLEQVFPLMAAEIKKLGRKETSIFGQNEVTRIRSIEVFNPSQRLKQQYGLDWSLLVATNRDAAEATLQQLLLTVSLGTGLALLSVAAIAAFLANRATRPILEAAIAVNQIGQGKLDTRVEAQGEDELGQLGFNINNMASQLQTFTQEQILLAKVAGSRTFNLQELESVFNNTLEDARHILNVDRLIIYRFNPDFSGYISAEAVARGLFHSLDNKFEDALISEQLLESYKNGLVTPINNVFEENLYPHQMRLTERLQIVSLLEAPILLQGQPYGLLMAHYSAPRQWQSSDINFLKQLAAQFGLSLDRVTLLEETEQLAQEQRQLKEGLQQRALQLLKEVDPISKGDLTIRARVTADEIGTIADAYNSTVANLRKIVLQVQDAAGQVAQTTSSNEASVQSLSTEALRQAEEIAAALERAQEMAESVRVVALNAEQAEVAVREAAMTVQEGDAAMNRTVDGILAIRETVAETSKKVKHLGESSQKISTVVNLISTFAAQTNLLALNASIEAARAGEEGRGFAVVADEVRSLARQSAEATSEIEKLVAAIQAETNEVVAAMEAGTEQVVTGTKLVDETRQSLNKITAASVQINDLVEAITQATVVQSHASEAVTRTMANVAQIADKTSQEANFVSSSFEQLRQVAQTLQEDVGQFKVS
ncbi:MAG TPA: methyl-accepting chemotaxis protein [Coleofasciculaceae cyanobacterium]|jgi:twitching motility protein PilJ/methyl-accepting chemotaxis protein PixJ